MTYSVHSIFLTIQGEGHHAGKRAVFIRFAGCNVWSGHEKDRARDTAKGCCAAWCDTDFAKGTPWTEQQIVSEVKKLWGVHKGLPLVVITGGEPSLQLDQCLVDALQMAWATVHVETNGSRPLPKGVDWITLSPKPPMHVCSQDYHEVKVVVPAVNHETYAHHAPLKYVQPLDGATPEETRRNMAHAVGIVMDDPTWRLSVQTHKILEIP